MTAALFLDRDGVINVDHAYVHQVDQFDWMPGVFDTVRAAIDLGLAVIVITNQAGIARGFYDEKQFHALTDWMKTVFLGAGAPLTDVYFCPFHPEGLPPYNVASDHRKPAPGMLLQAAREHHIDLTKSLLIGDQESDVRAGRAAGLRGVALLAESAPETTEADIVLPDHAAACCWLHDICGQTHIPVVGRA